MTIFHGVTESTECTKDFLRKMFSVIFVFPVPS